jgi:hypothetical protein
MSAGCILSSAVCLLLLTGAASAQNLERVDCASVQTRKALIKDINEFPALKKEGLSIIDLSEPKTSVRGSEKLVCNYLVAFSDGDNLRMDIILTKNSIGNIIIEIKE